MDAISSSLAGLRAASTRVAARAENIANQQTDGYRQAVPVQVSTPGGPEVKIQRAPQAQRVDPITGLVVADGSIETDFVDIVQSKAAYKANAAVLRTANELTDSLLDILA